MNLEEQRLLERIAVALESISQTLDVIDINLADLNRKVPPPKKEDQR